MISLERRNKPSQLAPLAGILLGLGYALAVQPCMAQQEVVTVEVVAAAEFDECVKGTYTPKETLFGKNRNRYRKSGLSEEEVADCYAAGGLAKRNQAYVWSLKKIGDQLWWGTGPNINSLVSGSYFGNTEASLSEVGDQIAERASAKFAVRGVIDEESGIDYGFKVFEGFGDYRPPNIYCYDLDTEQVRRLDLDMPPEDTELLWQTLGLRSVGYTAPLWGFPKGIAFFAGPSVAPTPLQTTDSLPEVLGINMFAFDLRTGRCIGSKSFPEYSNIRKWKEHDGQLYTCVANQDGTGQVLKHDRRILRRGFPFNFEVVGELASGGAEIEVFDGRLFVNTWPGIEGNFELGPENFQQILNLLNGPASLYRSPVIPRGGLRSSHADDWSVVWSSVDYDPDIAISLHYGGGAMAAFGDYLYWGTTHVAGTAQVANQIVYGPPARPVREDYEDDEAFLIANAVYLLRLAQDAVNPQRYISIWRGKDFTQEGGNIELLYGNERMPSRMNRSSFTTNGTPRGQFNVLKWGLFIINNLGRLGQIQDGEEVVLLSIPLPFGRTWEVSTTFEDGGDWEIVPNVNGWQSKYGREGVTSVAVDAELLGLGPQFGAVNYSGNNYTWSMEVFDNQLYFGTLDLAGTGLYGYLNPDFRDGADLYRFPDTESPAELISSTAFGNPYAYGIRNLVADEARKALYAGTANPSNLRHANSQAKVNNQPINTDDNSRNDDFETLDPANGGWELLRLSFSQEVGLVDEPLVEHPAVKGNAGPESLSDSVGASDEWLLKAQDTSSATVSFTSVSPEASGMKSFTWASFPGMFYTVYVATEPQGEWAPVQTYNGTGGTLTYEWDATSSDISYIKVVESSELPGASL